MRYAHEHTERTNWKKIYAITMTEAKKLVIAVNGRLPRMGSYALVQSKSLGNKQIEYPSGVKVWHEVVQDLYLYNISGTFELRASYQHKPPKLEE